MLRELMARRWRRMLVWGVTRTWGVRSNAWGVLVVGVIYYLGGRGDERGTFKIRKFFTP